METKTMKLIRHNGIRLTHSMKDADAVEALLVASNVKHVWRYELSENCILFRWVVK